MNQIVEDFILKDKPVTHELLEALSEEKEQSK